MSDFNDAIVNSTAAEENSAAKNPATETSSAAFSDWVNKLKFDKSFTAKLILSGDAVKGYYAAVATEVLKYARVKSHTGWSGVTFTVGRDRFASLSFVGKTLCLYLAVDPETFGGGKYKTKNVEAVKKYAKTPAMLKIKSEGGKRYALKLIAAAAENHGLKIAEQGSTPVNPANFKTDTFNNLVTRGLIRIIRSGNPAFIGKSGDGFAPSGFYGEPVGKQPPVVENQTELSDDSVAGGVYDKIFAAMSEGDCRASLSEKLMLRAVDEAWVKAIEDCISSIDELIRNPNHFIAETEEVLPIELTKKITGRSVAHLCRHTDYIRPEQNGTITPVKMLNVFREDSLLTYENKFLNTLINKLYLFVGKRYSVMKERGADEKTETLEFDDVFSVDDGKARVKITVEYSSSFSDDAKKILAGGGLWARVERIYDIVTGYVNSSFAKSMDRNFIRPPVMRTNAIIKNKYFKECLALWEFIESYDDAGYGITVDEKQKEISNDYAKQVYETAASLYNAFRRNLNGEISDEYSYGVTPSVVSPDRYSFDRYSEDFEREGETSVAADSDMTFELLVALMADERLSGDKLRKKGKCFYDKLCASDVTLKSAFADLCNAALKYGGVKLRYSHKYATIRKGRAVIAKFAVTGKSLKVYFACGVQELPEKYHAKSVAGVKKYADAPTLIKVKSARSLKYAAETLGYIAGKLSLPLAKNPPELLKAENFAVIRANQAAFTGEEIKPAAGLNAGTFKNDFADLNKDGIDSNFAVETVSVGTQKSDAAVKNAQEAERLKVKEGSLYDTVTDTKESFASAAEPADTAAQADDIFALERVDNNYSKPTEYGIDDSSGFMAYENSIGGKAEKTVSGGLRFRKRHGKK